MSNLVWIIPCSLFLAFWVFNLLIRAPYVLHARQEKKTEKQQLAIEALKGKIGTKQQIRNFVGLASLQTIYVGEINKSFTMQLDTPNQLELKRLSELPDFDNFLSFKEN